MFIQAMTHINKKLTTKLSESFVLSSNAWTWSKQKALYGKTQKLGVLVCSKNNNVLLIQNHNSSSESSLQPVRLLRVFSKHHLRTSLLKQKIDINIWRQYFHGTSALLNESRASKDLSTPASDNYNNEKPQRKKYKKQARGKSKQQASRSTKHIKRLLPHLFSDDDDEPLPTTTVEKQLLGLMQLWEMDTAVSLLKQSVEAGVEPDRTVMLNLLQQLANLGEVECLLELHEYLKDRGLFTNLKFYHCLRDAYFNSGRVDEGILMLRMIYHSSRDFEDTDLFFTLLATMTARHFGHQLPLVEQYVVDLENSALPETSARASLWRCLVLAHRFDLAEEQLKQHPGLAKMLPAQVTKIVQSQLEMDYDRDLVLPYLINSPYMKPGLAASVFNLLILYKSEQGEWSEGLTYLSEAMSQGRSIHQKTVEMFLSRFLARLTKEQVQQLSVWSAGLENVEDKDD